MENATAFVKEGNQMNQEKPPPRVCPRCNSDNTKFCYYNNYSLSQPRYSCKNCRRYWTHGGALRNIPIGGSSRKKGTNLSQPSASQVLSVNLQHQVNHPHFSSIQENNGFLGSFGGSSTATVGNPYRSFPEIYGDTHRIYGQMEDSNFTEGSFRQNYFNSRSNDFVGNPLVNQPTGRHVYNYSGYPMNQEDPNRWNQSFYNNMDMNNIASTSGNRGSPVINNCISRSSYHLEKNGP